MEDLPESVMFDILSRLPVKTIIHCKCVCKKWRNIVSDTHFVNVHFSRSRARLMIQHKSAKHARNCHKPGILKEYMILPRQQWKSLGHVPYWLNGFDGPFLNGHAHWIVIDQDSPEKICAFDFDNETFKLFPSPLIEHKEVVIKESISPDLYWLMSEPVSLTQGLKDGTILMVFRDVELLAYCPTRKTVEDTQIFDRYLTAMSYRPSFLKLQNFELERVHVL
ncbi:F-box associated domain, type 1 [Artemisia annua]|uniref:F-box associated domain, type 1 n=1 Tax=Artemisia annua TaxID=35608 RepID=A0A2U1PYI0_ARTAN|nr:F-box associated domain, type 1 [Artemisia annua]